MAETHVELTLQFSETAMGTGLPACGLPAEAKTCQCSLLLLFPEHPDPTSHTSWSLLLAQQQV